MQPISTGLLSYGMSGKLFHAPFIDVHPGFRLDAVWERSKSLAQERYPAIATYRTLEELLADERLELVIVNTPNYTHYEYARKALEAGKHVVVEKPFVVRVEEGEDLVRLAAEKGLLISVYHNRRFDSDYKAVRQVIEEGLLGDIVEAEFHFDRFKQDLSPKLHKEEPGPGTGALYDLGSHLIDQALQLFGWPEAVFADIRIIRRESRVDDYFELLLYYGDKRVRLHSSYLVREPLPAYILHGRRGSFIKPKTDVQEADLLAEKLPGSEGWGREGEGEQGLLHFEGDSGVLREYRPGHRGNYMDYFEAIFQSIRNGAPLPVFATDGLNVIRIIEAAFRSSSERKVIDLSPLER